MPAKTNNMWFTNRLRVILAVGLALNWAAGPATPRTKNGDKFFSEGSKAEKLKQLDKALDFYRQAVAEDSSDVRYRLAFLRVRFQAAQAHIEAGQKLRSQGKLEDAAAEFEKAVIIDPSSEAALQELRRVQEMIEAAKKEPATEEGKLLAQGLTPAEIARKEVEQKLREVLTVPRLKPLSAAPITLKINNQPPKIIFETIGKLAGINVLFDPDYQQAPGQTGKNVSLDLSNATLEQALDYASVVTKSFWKPLSENAVFITNDVQNKRVEYEDQIAKVFYLSNITAQAELAEVVNAIRQVTGAVRIMPFTSQNAIIVRGTADQVELAEMIIHDLDRPRSEVVVDVIVMEVNRTRSRDLALTPVSGGTAGLNIPGYFAPRNPVSIGGSTTGTGSGSTTGASSAVSVANLGRLSSGDFAITLPGAALKALMSDSATKVLQAPQVRTLDNQKATLKIGQRYPIASGGFQPLFGQVGGGSQLYSNFQFQDVGVNMDILPKVHNAEEVSLHIEMDVSAVGATLDIGGISQPIINQRRVAHDIRLREGEVSLLGGLLQDQETKSVSGVPGLASIPLLRRLFTSETVQKNEQEVLIAIIPHIVRAPDFKLTNFKGIAVGTESRVRVNFAAPKPEAGTPAPQAPATVIQPQVPAAPAPGSPKPQAPAPALPPAPPHMSFNPSNIEVQAGSTFTLNLVVENVENLVSAPLRIKFDQSFLRLNDVTRGDFMGRDGQQVLFTRNILNDTGDATINLSRMPAAPSVSGSGILVTLSFQAVKSGVASVAVAQGNLQDAQGRTVLGATPQAVVRIK